MEEEKKLPAEIVGTPEVVEVDELFLEEFPEEAYEISEDDSDYARKRLKQIHAYHGFQEAKQEVYNYVYKQNLAGLPADRIARNLNMSVRKIRSVLKDIRKLSARQLATSDPNEMLAKSMMVLDQISQLAVHKIASDPNMNAKAYSELLNVVTKTETGKQKMMADAGYNQLKPLYGTGAETLAEAETLDFKRILKAGMEGRVIEDEELSGLKEDDIELL